MQELFVQQNTNLLKYKKKKKSSAIFFSSTLPKTAQLPCLASLFPADIKKIDVNPVDMGKHHSKYG